MNLGKTLALLALLPALLPAAAQAQEPGAPTGSAPDANTQSWQQQKSAPPPSFQAIRAALNEVLTGPNLDPQRHSYHFVVLLNTAKTNGAGSQMMRDTCYGLLRYELAAGPGSSDEFTLAPFQLQVRTRDCRWNETFSPQRAPELYGSIPLSPAEEPGFIGGNDIEGALLYAVTQVKDPQSAIYITLSDNEVSQPPVKPLNYRLTDSDPQVLAARMKAAHLVKAKSDRIALSQQVTTPGVAPVYIYYRIYTPDNLRPLGEWTSTTRDQLLAGSPPTTPVTKPEQPVRPIAHPNGQTDQHHIQTPPPKPDPATDYTWLIVGALVVLLIAAGIGYSVLSKRPHSISVGVNSMRTAQLVPGKPIFLSSGEGNGLVPIDGLPEDITPGEKVAQVDVSPFGAVTVRSAVWKVENSPVAVGDTKRIRISRNSSGGLLGGDSITVTVKKDS